MGGVTATSVFVDDLMKCLPSNRWHWPEACHLMVFPGTPLEVLHQFATGLGLKRKWFQYDGTAPHYDLNPAKRQQAVRCGAIEVTREEIVALVVGWREWRKAHLCPWCSKPPGLTHDKIMHEEAANRLACDEGEDPILCAYVLDMGGKLYQYEEAEGEK